MASRLQAPRESPPAGPAGTPHTKFSIGIHPCPVIYSTFCIIFTWVKKKASSLFSHGVMVCLLFLFCVPVLIPSPHFHLGFSAALTLLWYLGCIFSAPLSRPCLVTLSLHSQLFVLLCPFLACHFPLCVIYQLCIWKNSGRETTSRLICRSAGWLSSLSYCDCSVL